jgi:pimeloyl-ACP methyl ester carboxylesterase
VTTLPRPTIALLAALAVCAFDTPGAAQVAPTTAPPPRWLTLPEPPPMPRPDTAVVLPASGGARLYAAVFHRGGPAPVLLLHGGMASSDVWAEEAARLAPSHEVLVMDARGHGRSTLGEDSLSYALLAADAIAVLDSLHVPRAAVVGWSDGGIAGLLLAIHHPQRIAGLLTYGANFDLSGYSTEPPDPRMAALGRQYIARVEAGYRRLSPTPDGFPALRAALESLYAREPAIAPAALRTIRVPTTIAAGDHEQFIARAHTERLAALIPGARLVILPDVSHGGPLQDPDGFHRVVEAFLATARF